jgi:hypothetical protein
VIPCKYPFSLKNRYVNDISKNIPPLIPYLQIKIRCHYRYTVPGCRPMFLQFGLENLSWV